jgi:DNA-binding transcriptional ArsR family regulator
VDPFLPDHSCIVAEALAKARHALREFGEWENNAFKALGDPTRFEILCLLRSGEMTAGQLAKCFKMTKPSMSHHFEVLKQADLIIHRRGGRRIYYSLNNEVLGDLFVVIWELFHGRRGPGKESKP